MTNKELALLQSAMNNSRNYLEFGSGNSTYMAVRTESIERISVVESDARFWEEQMLSVLVIKDALDMGRLRPHIVNIGAIGKWGYPIDDSCRNNWPTYHSCAFQCNDVYDLILVDGRFRVACILHSCLYCSNETKILIHDFFNRPNYYVVLPFLRLEQRADTLGLFSINKNKFSDLIEEYISIYEYLPDF